ncbi:hypothetical protein SKAU_G00231160 [Synaphobranchus kaupii]|uniref:Small membrane A-kinase anchor protein n=1 Tax=Synaphobranchus kaupii TaxID=118154 RepID=A0A9Q1ISD4_SYNKA|nr:hypothetical protein SKAU_G00231160 [Synaphobranchus kaupii]
MLMGDILVGVQQGPAVPRGLALFTSLISLLCCLNSHVEHCSLSSAVTEDWYAAISPRPTGPNATQKLSNILNFSIYLQSSWEKLRQGTCGAAEHQCYTTHMMGCIKSKHGDAAQGVCSVRNAEGKPGKGTRGERVALNNEMGPGEESLRVDPALLDYAQRLSEDIVALAVQQWAELDSRYSDIPYIECDVP